jgi:hypothetical protein
MLAFLTFFLSWEVENYSGVAVFISTDEKQVHRCVLESWAGLADRYTMPFNSFSMENLGFLGDVEIKLQGI